jgi:ribosomal protein S18 acetylase RimI-like enzyme
MIRDFSLADMQACVELLIESYAGDPWYYRWTTETATRYLNEFTAADSFVGFVIEEDTAIVGAMFAHRKTWWTKDELFVDELFVTPRLQRRGLGSNLLIHAESYAKACDLAGLTLLTSREMPAPIFYSKQGYLQAEQVIFMYKVL